MTEEKKDRCVRIHVVVADEDGNGFGGFANKVGVVCVLYQQSER